ncbi:MAG: bifunctional riboflavin kinase/FAD synthetase [Gammaproteobacteria bacterium]|nr:bifunctional riboflavin kinase/FAD synthetase [Gammaproteobacteria bacterium]MCD8542423.1 bifunctional riboflavin kinase/FAD synthetase [Gammaproteobacteria bacterium]
MLRQLTFGHPLEFSSVLTLGNFDGVHCGHAWLIRRTVEYAKKHQLKSILLSFDPMPAEFFSPTSSPARLMRFLEKWPILQSSGLDACCILPFKRPLMELSALDFVKKILVEHFRVKHLFVGDDFRFGYQRQGDVELLHKLGKVFGFSVSTHTEFFDGNKTISSTWIRAAIKAGDFLLAEKLLGRPYKNRGRVVYGAQLGRQLGCPTANIPMNRHVSPVHGVYVVFVEGDNLQYYGVASVGNRPAVGGKGPAFLLEVHLFDFSGNLYGKRLEVSYLHKLRDEWMFDSLDALKIQIQQDCEMARQYLKKRQYNNVRKI